MNQYVEIKNTLAEYYGKKITDHGPTAEGVDGRERSQLLRFARFDALFEDDALTSVCDFGCGYGAHLTHIRESRPDLEYLGIDIAPEMIAASRELHETDEFARFEVGGEPREADIVIASGIFNIKGDTPDENWRQYILDTLDEMWNAARIGIGYNILTTCARRRRDDLYFADLIWLIEQNQKRLNDRINIDQSYDLYEATILIWKGDRP